MTENDTNIELSSSAKNLIRKTVKVALVAAVAVVAVKFGADRLNKTAGDTTES